MVVSMTLGFIHFNSTDLEYLKKSINMNYSLFKK